jgi:hypothetical protein
MHGQYVGLNVKTRGDGYLYFMIMKQNWTFPSSDDKTGVEVPLAFGFDNDKTDYITAAARGYMGDGKYPTIDFYVRTDGENENLVAGFLEAFAHAENMWVKFKTLDELPWNIGMQGSRGAVNAFRNCIATLPNNRRKRRNYDGNAATQPCGGNKTSSERRDEDI